MALRTSSPGSPKALTVSSLKQIIKKYSSLCDLKNAGNYINASLQRQTSFQEVPKGHFVVYVGEKRNRYIAPIWLLDRPEFKCLLQRAEDEYGFYYYSGLVIPCDETEFLALLDQ